MDSSLATSHRRSTVGRETIRSLSPLLVVLGAFAITIFVAFQTLGRDADALAEREYQAQQSLLAAQAAERLGDQLERVERHLGRLTPPADPTESTIWLTAPEGVDAVVAATSESGVAVVDPANQAALSRWVSEQPGLLVRRALEGRAGWSVLAGVDGRVLHEALFSSLGQTHDAYIWVIDGERRIVSAPDASQVGTMPFGDVPDESDLGHVLAAMVRGETGVGSYDWSDQQGDRTRLVAYTSVPGRDLRVAYSADRASVLALTHELHTRQRVYLLALLGALVFLVAVALVRLVRRYRERLREAERLGPYTLREPLGQGGMGVVYEAKHALLRRPTAIKLLHQELSTPKNLERFEHEVQMTAALTHTNTVTVFDFGRTDDGVFYYAMELIDGPTLRDVVEDTGPLEAARVVHLLDQAAGAIAEAHAAGLIHRDLKPENLMVCERGGVFDVAKVLDFGLVREIEKGDGERIAGTPLYMAPEIFMDSTSVDERSDVYAFGAVAYYLLTGTDVFDGATVTELAAQHALDPPEGLTRRLRRLGNTRTKIPDELERLVLECLAKDPEKRPRDAAELQDRLAGCGLAWLQKDARAAWEKRPTRQSIGHAETRAAATEMGLARTRPAL
ncbi:MAG: protein kinase [Myxococcota bacterium]